MVDDKEQDQDAYIVMMPGDTVNDYLPINDPFIRSYARDLLRIYNAAIDILPEGENGRLEKYIVNVSDLSVISCMNVIRNLVRELALIYQKLENDHSEMGNHDIFKFAENYIMELNFAGEILHEKYIRFLGSAFAMRAEKYDFGFVSSWDWPADDFMDLDCAAESTFRLVNDMAHIFYGEVSMPIIITYREEGRGGGAGFDHYNLQRITGRSTIASVAEGLNISTFGEYIKSKDSPEFPEKIDYLYANEYGPEDMGMVVVPGFATSSLPLEDRPKPLKHYEKENNNRIMTHINRIKHERQLIRSSKKNRVPVLAICGGLQTMTETFSGKVSNLPPDKKSMHSKRMMKMLPSGELENVTPAHAINISPGSLLYNYLHKFSPPAEPGMKVDYEITSVHWFSVSKLPKGFITSAYASYFNEVGGYDVDCEVIEAIENKNLDDRSEAPMIAIQGHPEAMSTSQHDHPHAGNYYSLFKSMAIEGDSRHKMRILFKNKRSREMTLEEMIGSDSLYELKI